ncbi:MAG: serine--tRNA ligase, partial [Rikenellaceae bacterium]
MLTLKIIRQQTEEVIERLKIKGHDAEQNIKEIISLDDNRRKVQTTLDETNSKLNNIAKEVGMLFKEGKIELANE